MAGASISHVLIVAGPSGAGKSAFLRELAAGRLSEEILHHLPDSAETWEEVCSIRSEWRLLFDGRTSAEPLSGVAVHYDVTSMWLHLKTRLGRDPFWAMLDHCAEVTVVKIRPTHRRLMRQWIHAHLGADRMWSARGRALWIELTTKTLVRLRPWIARLIGSQSSLPPNSWQHRLLTALDIRVIAKLHALKSFRFYREDQASARRMMRSWDRVIAARLNGLPTKYVELAPDDSSKIAKTFRWHVVKVSTARDGRAAPAGAEVGALPTVVAPVTAAIGVR